MVRTPDWLSRSEVYGEAIRDWVQLSRYRFDFVTHVPPDREWMARLRSLGSRPIPYVTMYQQPMYYTYQGIDLRDHPDWIEVDEKGNWKRTSFWDSEDQKNWYVLCPNVKGYVDAILEHVGALMEDGAGGIFVDNVGQRKRCYGPEHGVHEHVVEDQVEAFASLLGQVRTVIRDHDPEGVLLVNSASPHTLPAEYWEEVDADMAESYICTWVSDERWMDWHGYWNYMGRKVAPLLEKGRSVLALSYLGHTHNSIKDDAYFCYCSARLSGFLWSAGGDVLRGDPAEVLYSIRLGPARGPEKVGDDLHRREFEGGLVIVNAGSESGQAKIKPPPGKVAYDLYTEEDLGGGEAQSVEVPANSGRVYLYLPEYSPADPEIHVLRISTQPALGNVRFLVDGIETFTRSGRWKIEYDKGPDFGTAVSKYQEPGRHTVEAVDLEARSLELSRGYGSIEKLGKLMDPAEPTRPAGDGYRFREWILGGERHAGPAIQVDVRDRTELVAVYVRPNR